MMTNGGPQRSYLLSEVLKLARLRNPMLSPSTAASYAQLVRLASSFLGREPTCDEFFQVDQVSAFIGWLIDTPDLRFKIGRHQRSAHTVRQRLMIIRTFWRLAHRRGYCSQPVPDPDWLPKIRAPLEAPVCWSLEEVLRILDQAKQTPPIHWWGGDHWYVLLATFFVTAERFGTLLYCPYDALDADGVLRIPAGRAKDRKGTAHVLPPRLVELYRALPRIDAPWAGQEFRDSLFQWPLKPNALREAYRRDILKPAGLPHGPKNLFHCLRKSSLTDLVNRIGLDAATRQARHFSSGLTMSHYIDPSKLHDKPLARVLGESIGFGD